MGEEDVQQLGISDLRAEEAARAQQQLLRQKEMKQDAGIMEEEADGTPIAPPESTPDEPQTLDPVRGPLLNTVPKVPEPRKSAPKPETKPTQGELLQKNVTLGYPRLVNYLKQAEGNAASQAASGSFKGGRFRIYDDVGSPAIGYGHRVTPEESRAYKNGITEEEASRILMQDIKKAEILTERHFGRKGWAAMDQHRREMAIDFMFNLGPGRKAGQGQSASGMSAFITFSRALRLGDVETIRAKYKRNYSPTPGAPKIPLKPRNDLFYKTYVLPLETGAVEIGQPRKPKEPIRQALR